MKRILISIIILSAFNCQAKSNKCCGIPQIQLGINNIQNIQSRILNLVNTIIQDLPSTACSSIAITATTTITEPGNYCLANNITGGITINSNDVSLNLNSFALNGSLSINGSHVTVFNGTITGNGSNSGIFISGTGTHIHNVTITNFINGILVLNGASNIVITNVASHNNVGGPSTSHGALIDGATNIIIKDSQFNDNVGNGLLIDNSNNIVVYNCMAHGNATGFNDSIYSGSNNNSNMVIMNCTASSNGIGFNISGQSTLLANCAALSSTNLGFVIQGLNGLATSATLLECSAISNTNSGFAVQQTGTPTSVTFWCQDCVSNNNGIGFNQTLTTGAPGTFKACSATNNSGCGFNDAGNAGATVAQYAANYASQNNSNYCLAGFLDLAAYSATLATTTGIPYWTNVYV